MPPRTVFRIPLAVAGAVVAASILAVAPVAAASADPLFEEGGCVVLPVSDGGAGGAQCAGVDLSGTRFGEADFTGADLAGASFVDGDVQGAVFTGADLAGADFTGTRIVGADFTGSSILPATLTAEADETGTAPIEIAPAVPTGLTVEGCSIVGTPVESGQSFPVGTSSMLCSISSSFAGTASALVTIEVTASVSAPATQQPLFTEVPVTGAPVAAEQGPDGLLIGLLIGGGALVALGVVAFVLANRRPRER
ncbi:pentapeptide repeat-containing protein [Herbiconiux moechotypicola]|uniref:Pentapeptide repeat-containing protein n=1 Tax=Herbiconiux moechotypicola TaxID=637393 RepID=A0ABP5QKM4_9MICO|nr:pentapeptide repeat-containing protein [Herbiconiux moechotypicola]MCS5730295.1 pentapeptide repeat-containing protein [Herbiconiux moechotypicola]